MPTVLTALASRLEQSDIASWVNSSRYILGLLSGAHLVGFAVVVGAGLVSARYLPGTAGVSGRAVARSLIRVMSIGLSVSVGTGVLLVTPRAVSALENWIFVLKMTLLIAAVVVHGALLATRVSEEPASPVRRAGIVVAALLWVAVGAAGCAFILLE